MSGHENIAVRPSTNSRLTDLSQLVFVCWLGAGIGVLTIFAVYFLTAAAENASFSIGLSSTIGLTSLVVVVFSPPHSLVRSLIDNRRLSPSLVTSSLVAIKLICLSFVCLFSASSLAIFLATALIVGSELLLRFPLLLQFAKRFSWRSNSETSRLDSTSVSVTENGRPLAPNRSPADSATEVIQGGAESDWPLNDASHLLKAEALQLDDSPHELFSGDAELAMEEEQELPCDVTQQITRSKQPDGGELIVCYLRCEFQPKQKLHVTHLPFCPQLKQIPEVNIHQLSGPTANVKMTQLECFGMRIETKLSQAHATQQSVLIEFIATTH